MIGRLPAAFVLLLTASAAAATTPACDFAPRPAGAQKLGAWIDQDNWLAIEHRRLTLQAADTFMPTLRLAPAGAAPGAPGRELPDRLPAVDPLDGSRRDLGFLLDSRLYADGVVVLRNGQLVAERYRNGLLPEQPRLLLDAARPLLNLLGAVGVSQGKLAADKSVVRYLPRLAAATGLRKVSVQRLLENDERPAWAAGETEGWRHAAGWTASRSGEGVRGWLAQPGRWDLPLLDRLEPASVMAPDDDLLAWVLAESHAMPLSRLFCEQLLGRVAPEHPVLWATDPQGVELAGGLALSLRDFAKLGQHLAEARSSRGRTKIPAWFIETLTAPAAARTGEIRGLAKGSEVRYGFVHLGGAPNRVALIAAHGSSLYIDFDKRLVIAVYATRPGAGTPAMLATLEQVWRSIEQATAGPDRKGAPQ